MAASPSWQGNGAWILEVAITTLLDFDAHVQTAEINATLPKPWQAVYDPESKAYYYWNTVCATNCTAAAWLLLLHPGRQARLWGCTAGHIHLYLSYYNDSDCYRTLMM